jgi:hypothetical protein
MNERNTLVLCVVISAFGMSGCNNRKAPESVSVASEAPAAAPVKSAPAANSGAAAARPAPPAVAGEPVTIEWTVPPTWTQGPARPMRKATYNVPAASGDTAMGELAISYFGVGQGGDVEANIQRWIGQFKEVPEGSVKRSERNKDDLKIAVVEVPAGTYTNTMMGGPHGGAAPENKGYALLGAVVEAPSGKYFFKLTGPKATVAASRDAFDTVLDSLKQK